MSRAFKTAALVSFVTCRQTSRVYDAGSVIFSEGDVPVGVHILDSGQAKLFGSTSRGKTIITRIVRAGELLGLNAVILGKPYLFSAEATEPSRVSHVQRDDFLAFLWKSAGAARKVIEQLSASYYDATERLADGGIAELTPTNLARTC
jgi:CRP-like cAMP-binding protein